MHVVLGSIRAVVRRGEARHPREPPEVVITLVKNRVLTAAEVDHPPPYEEDSTAPVRFVSIHCFAENGLEATNTNLWEGGSLLARYLQDSFAELSLDRASCLELGAGLGSCGIKAVALGARYVVITDLPSAMPVIQYNVRSNLTERELQRVAAVAYAWGESQDELRAVHPTPFDFILCGDLVYHAALVHPLVKALDELTTPQTTVLLAIRSRPGKQAQQEAVLTGLQKTGFQLFRVDVPTAQRGTYLVRASRRRL